jgi:hypothetical protein
VLAAAVLLLAPSAAAFESIPPGDSAHDHITAQAAEPLGWTGRGLDGLQQAVRSPDVAESKVKGSLGRVVILDAQGEYEPSHHCDRLPPTPNAQVFAATSAYIRLERDEAIQLVHSDHPERAVGALGRALHALQDCHSHSNISDKDAAAQATFQDALLQGLAMPEGMVFTGFQPGDKQADMPAGDEYPHGLYAKDGTNTTPDAEKRLPDGRTKFEAAAALATSTSRMFLEDFLGRLNATEKATVLAVPPQHLNNSPIPDAGSLLLLPLLGAALLARRVTGKRRQ